MGMRRRNASAVNWRPAEKPVRRAAKRKTLCIIIRNISTKLGQGRPFPRRSGTHSGRIREAAALPRQFSLSAASKFIQFFIFSAIKKSDLQRQ
jgi:hypothetical protein